MTLTQKIVDFHREHPEMTPPMIAQRLGTRQEYVRVVAYRRKLVLPQAILYPNRKNSFVRELLAALEDAQRRLRGAGMLGGVNDPVNAALANTFDREGTP